jgi:molecular chaperone DnaK (HSP70)
VNVLSLGIEAEEGLMDPIIPRNIIIPTKMTKTISTT